MEQPIQLWIVGSIGIDDIQTKNTERTNLLGGSVPYATIAASFFTKVGAVGIVGSDFPKEFQTRWEKFGADLSGVQHAEGATFRWSGAYHDDMIERDTLKTELGVFADFHPELPESYQDAPFVLLGNIQPDLQSHVLEQAKNPTFVALDTMNLWIDIAKPALLNVIQKVNLLTVNDGEARLLTGKESLDDCASEILEMGPEFVIIKRGEYGSALYSKQKTILVPPFKIQEVIDPTGAGDSYAGAFMGRLAQLGTVNEETLQDALLYASAVASFGVEGFSCEKFETLTREMIEDRFKALQNQIH